MNSKNTSKIRIFLADDHLIVRMGIASMLSLEHDLEIVGEAADGDEAVRLCGKLSPDVVIMDLMMPKKNGAEATAEIRERNPGCRILILTTFGTSDDVRAALASGAAGALIKDSDKSTLVAAIRTVSRGGSVISPEIESALGSRSSPPELSARHREILAYIAKGLNNREIARALGIGHDCVKAHLKTVFARLCVASRSEAVATAIREHLIES